MTLKHTIPRRWKNILASIDSTDMNEPEREGLKHDIDCEFQLGIEELQQLLKRKRYPEKGYCPVWDNAFDYAIKQVLGEPTQ